MNAIEEIMRFQFDRGLHKQPYNPINEHTNIIEELLESIGFDVPKDKREELLLLWERYVVEMEQNAIIFKLDKDTQGTWEQIDAYGDVIVFAIGAIAKLGYDPEKVLLEIGKEINSRSGYMINGKFEKDLSIESKAKWYKANFKHCELAGSEKLQKRRKAFFATEGYMGSEQEVEEWVKSIL